MNLAVFLAAVLVGPALLLFLLQRCYTQHGVTTNTFLALIPITVDLLYEYGKASAILLNQHKL